MLLLGYSDTRLFGSVPGFGFFAAAAAVCFLVNAGLLQDTLFAFDCNSTLQNERGHGCVTNFRKNRRSRKLPDF